MNFVLGIIEQVSSGGSSGGYPVIIDVTQTVLTTGASRTVVLPVGITAGQMILIITDRNVAIDTIPADYTYLSGTTTVVYKIAAGGETTAVFTVSPSSGDTNSLAIVLASVHATTPPETVLDTSTDDPPSITATWGAANNLSIATLLSMASGGAISDYPSNCTLYRETFSAAVFDAAIAASETALATFNPNTFTATVTNQSVRTTIVRGT